MLLLQNACRLKGGVWANVLRMILVVAAFAVMILILSASPAQASPQVEQVPQTVATTVTENAADGTVPAQASAETAPTAQTAPAAAPADPDDCEVVKPGQTLSAMSAAHGRPGKKEYTKVAQEQKNPIADVNDIDPGWNICFHLRNPHPAPAAPASDPAPSRQQTSGYHGAVAEADWDRVAFKESTNRWDCNTGNGHYGGLQFKTKTWLLYGGGEFAPRADKATKHEQMTVAMRVLEGWKRVPPQGWDAWAVSDNVGMDRKYPQFNH